MFDNSCRIVLQSLYTVCILSQGLTYKYNYNTLLALSQAQPSLACQPLSIIVYITDDTLGWCHPVYTSFDCYYSQSVKSGDVSILRTVL